MKCFYSDTHSLHAPDWYVADGAVHPCPEVPARTQRLQVALAAAGMEMALADDLAMDILSAIRAVHAGDYLEYLENVHRDWVAEFGTQNKFVLPDTFPPRSRQGSRQIDMTRPAKRSAQAGYYCFDMAAPIGAGTFTAALGSAKCAVAAAQAVLHNRHSAYALCRPPGHHAGKDYCGGFCYLNNAAIAAQRLIAGGMKRVAVFDMDYHHGNGTQDIFYAREDVMFVSIHADPNTQYPYFWGSAEETGTAEGIGSTFNFPLPRGTPETAWLDTCGKALAKITAFRSEGLVVSLGADVSSEDTVGDFGITLAGFTQLGKQLGAMGLPTVLVQEGGYHLESLGPCVSAVLTEFAVPLSSDLPR